MVGTAAAVLPCGNDHVSPLCVRWRRAGAGHAAGTGRQTQSVSMKERRNVQPSAALVGMARGRDLAALAACAQLPVPVLTFKSLPVQCFRGHLP